MIDLRDQLRSYAELMDAAAPPLEQLTPDTSPVAVPLLEPEPPTPRAGPPSRRWGPSVAAFAAGAVVLLALLWVGAVLRGDDLVADTTSTTTVTSTTTAPTTTVPPVAFALTSEAGVVDFGVEGSDFTGPGGIVVADGRFHMFRNGTIEERLDPTRGNKVGYLVSDDGVSWTEPDPAPLWADADVPYGTKFSHARSAVRGADGIWRIFFDVGLATDDEDTESEPATVIGLATAPDPLGPWTVLPEPILASDERGFVASPSVIETSEGFVMYFVAGPDRDAAVVRRATSPDGIAWTVDAAPVLAPNQAWQRGSIVLVDAERVGDTWVLFYSGDTRSRRGFATSTDGVTFAAYDGNPIVDTTLLPRGSVFDSEVVFADGRWYLYIENGGTRSDSIIVLLTYDGALPPG